MSRLENNILDDAILRFLIRMPGASARGIAENGDGIPCDIPKVQAALRRLSKQGKVVQGQTDRMRGSGRWFFSKFGDY